MNREAIARRLDHVFALYDELVASLDSDQLRSSLPVPSNPIGMQLWCVVGARETWARALVSGTWGPFSCSVESFEDSMDPKMMRVALGEAAAAVRQASSAAPFDDARGDLLISLLEHEVQHTGQLLRYLLGLEYPIPQSWRQQFAL